MIRRHEEMFPRMHQHASPELSQSGSSLRGHFSIAEPPKPAAVPDRYAPCPCNSGRKYKFCCGSKGR